MMEFLSLFGVIWNQTFADKPAGSRSPSLGDDDIREFKEAVYERLDKEHVMDTGSGLAADDGYHLEGSAKIWSSETAPTTRPDGVALSAADDGRVWRKPSTGEISYYEHGAGGWQTQLASSSAFTAGEGILSPEVVCVDTNGYGLVADKRYSEYSSVVGLAVAAALSGAEVVVQKSGLIKGFTGLVEGTEYFLGEGGAVTTEDDIDEYEFRCRLGYAVTATSLDLNIQEPTLNAPQDVLTVRAFKGKKMGLDMFHEGSGDIITVRPGACHVNDGITDWWVEVGTETAIDTSALTDGTWYFVLMDRFGNITTQVASDTGYNSNAVRPLGITGNNFYIWREYDGAAGYDHAKMGYYYGTKRVLGAINPTSPTAGYIINQLDGSDEIGACSGGDWVRKGSVCRFKAHLSLVVSGTPASATDTAINFPFSFAKGPYAVGGFCLRVSGLTGNILVTSYTEFPSTTQMRHTIYDSDGSGMTDGTYIYDVTYEGYWR